MIISKLIYILILFSAILFADIKVINKSTSKNFIIKTLKGEKKIYISTRDFVSALSSRLYENQDRKKLVLYVYWKYSIWIYSNEIFIKISQCTSHISS